jgi:hypothetical protein
MVVRKGEESALTCNCFGDRKTSRPKQSVDGDALAFMVDVTNCRLLQVE